MGFFDKILKGLGFEDSENKDISPKKEKVKKEKAKKVESPTSASFDLNSAKEESSTTFETNGNVKKAENEPLKVFEPSSQVDVQKAIDILKQNRHVILKLSGFSDADFVRSLDFVSGAVYALGGKIEKVESFSFLLTI